MMVLHGSSTTIMNTRAQSQLKSTRVELDTFVILGILMDFVTIQAHCRRAHQALVDSSR
jgi:hypothetical protein